MNLWKIQAIWFDSPAFSVNKSFSWTKIHPQKSKSLPRFALSLACICDHSWRGPCEMLRASPQSENKHYTCYAAHPLRKASIFSFKSFFSSFSFITKLREWILICSLSQHLHSLLYYQYPIPESHICNIWWIYVGTRSTGSPQSTDFTVVMIFLSYGQKHGMPPVCYCNIIQNNFTALKAALICPFNFPPFNSWQALRFLVLSYFTCCRI